MGIHSFTPNTHTRQNTSSQLHLLEPEHNLPKLGDGSLPKVTGKSFTLGHFVVNHVRCESAMSFYKAGAIGHQVWRSDPEGLILARLLANEGEEGVTESR